MFMSECGSLGAWSWSPDWPRPGSELVVFFLTFLPAHMPEALSQAESLHAASGRKHVAQASMVLTPALLLCVCSECVCLEPRPMGFMRSSSHCIWLS